MTIKRTSILIYFLAFNFIQGSLLTPENNTTINYTHVLFEWDQIYQAESYNFQLSEDTSFNTVIANIDNETSLYIHQANITWNSTYFWRVRAKYSDTSFGEWINTNTFSTGSKISNAYSIISNDSSYNDGVTIFSSFFNYFSAIIDKDGNEIWNTADTDIVYYNTDYNGQLFGCYVNNDLEHYLPGIEFSIDSEYIWEEPNEEFLHHELIQLPNGNYLGLVEDIRLGPIPIGNWTPLYQALGYVADGIQNEFPWVGDKIVIWDKDTKEIIWEWNTFNYFSMLDYDIISDTWIQGFYNGRYDWTHANALDYTWGNDSIEKIYLSSRHLSRISKIDYQTKNLDWNIGLEMPSGDVQLGNDLGFSFQHGINKNQNSSCFAILDNGNISEFILDTDYPTTRALYICYDEVNDTEPYIEWEYSLPENYFGFASGNVQKLENDNFLITTVGDGGSVLEIDYDKNIVWEGKLNLQLPNGAVYRANRVAGLYPIHYSTTLKEYNGTSYTSMGSDNENFYTNYNHVSLILKDHGALANNYTNFSIIINFENEPDDIVTDCILNDYDMCSYSILNISNSNFANIQIIPLENIFLTKEITIIFDNSSCTEEVDCLGVCGGNAVEDCAGMCNGDLVLSGCDNICGSTTVEDCAGICGGSSILDDCGICNGDSSSCQSCDSGYTFYENIPNSTIVLDGSSCFNDNDLNALNDIIVENSLDLESPVYLGTQNWSNGRMTRLEVGNYYQGGQVILTILPESIGNISELSVLYANYNELTQLPDSITSLTNLFFLVLSFNQLTSLPEQIGDLSNLYWIDAGYNQLVSLPESIGELQNLVYLWIFNNNLTSLPSTFCNLNINWNADDNSFLPYFGSGGNQLCENVPTCIESSPNFDSSIDPLYYSFEITLEQECEELCSMMDINSDGIINVIDIVAVVNIILGNLNPTEAESCAADINSDGIINVIDIVAIVNYILN